VGESDELLPQYRAFLAPQIHWRFHQSLLQYLIVDETWARIRAERIAVWIKDFDPELLWVFPELEAVAVARHLVRLLNVPLHLTIHDAPRCVAHSGMSPVYVGRFLRNVKFLTDRASSFDAVSKPLLDHLGAEDPDSFVYAPSMPSALMREPAVQPDEGEDGRLRRIGLCGSLRVSADQWQAFLSCLGDQPFRFEIVIVSDPDRYPSVIKPDNVKIIYQPYLETETALITFLREAGLFACYVGLWREADRELFARTSLSSKLSAYATAGIPTIIDGPEGSAAWQLVRTYEAGILLGDGAAPPMADWFEDVENWSRRSSGARRLAADHFDLERNVEKLKQLWAVGT